jgi:hypothetical protein
VGSKCIIECKPLPENAHRTPSTGELAISLATAASPHTNCRYLSACVAFFAAACALTLQCCDVISAVIEFVVRVLHSTSDLGIHDVVWRHQCGGRVHGGRKQALQCCDVSSAMTEFMGTVKGSGHPRGMPLIIQTLALREQPWDNQWYPPV